MSHLNIFQKEVLNSVLNKAFVCDSKGSLSVAGIQLRGVDGCRTLEFFMEGINQDVKELNPGVVVGMYRNICKDPEHLRKALEAPMKLSRINDANIIAGR